MEIARVTYREDTFHCGVRDGHVFRIDGDVFGDHEQSDAPLPVGACGLLPPVIPANFYAAGLNYSRHKQNYKDNINESLDVGSLRPDIGYKSNNALVASGRDIVIPRDSSRRVQ